jgi:hypothetical protein
MAYEQKDMSGSLFKNDKKGNDRAPDYRGKCMVNGTLLDMSAWMQTSQDGTKKYMSIKFSPPYNAQQQAPAPEAYQPSPSPVHNQVVAAAASRPASARPAPAPQQEQDQIPF